MTKGGVYAVRIPQYKDRYPQNKILKIGHSTNIEHRFSSHDTFALPEDSLLHHIETVVHSPTNAVSGTHILESLIHHYYRQHRMSQDREFFKFDLPFSIGPELITYLGTKNIQDVSLYSSLADVPKTILDPSYVENQNDMAATVMTDLYIPRLCQLPILKALLNHFQTYDKGGLYLPPGIGKTYLVGFMLNRMLNLSRILILTPQIMIGDEFRKMLGHLGTGNRQLICVSSEDRNIEDLQPTLATLPRYVLISTYQTYCQKATFFESQYDLIVFDEAHHLATSPTYQSALQLRGKKLFLTATPKIIHSDLETDEVVTYSLDNEEVYGPPIYSLTLIDAIQQGILCDYRFLIYQEEVVPTVMMETEQDSEDGDDNDDNGSESGSDDSSEDILGSVQSDAMVRDPTVCEPHIRMLVDLYGRKRILVFYNNCSDASGASQRLAQMMPHIQSFYVDGSLSKTQRQSIFEKFEQDDPTPKVLFNVNIVSEGVSLPCVDCILLMATKTSSIALIQLIGRALRLYNGKTEAIVCIPSRCSSTIDVCLESVYVDAEKSRTKSRTAIESRILVESVNTENIQRFIKVKVTAIEVSRTGGLWEYKWKLCQEWESLNPNQSIPQKTSQIGSWIDTQKASWKNGSKSVINNIVNGEKKKTLRILSDQEQQQLKQLHTWNMWMNANDPWETAFKLCLEWERINKDQTIKLSTVYQEKNIGTWFNNQKTAWNKGPHPLVDQMPCGKKKKVQRALSDHQRNSMEQLYSFKQWMHAWKLTFESCKEWERINTDQMIKSSTVFQEKNIGAWFNTQRTALKKTQILENPQSTTEEKTQAKKCEVRVLSAIMQFQLEELLTWRARLTGGDSWKLTLYLCKEWERINTDQTIKSSTVHREKNIGGWISEQKKAWSLSQKLSNPALSEQDKEKLLKHRSVVMSTERQSDINELHTWRTWLNDDDSWNVNFQVCKEWERINTDQTIKSSTVYRERNIGTWFARQKKIWIGFMELFNPDLTEDRKIYIEKNMNGLMNDERGSKLDELLTWRTWLNAEDPWTSTFRLCQEWERLNSDKVIATSIVYMDVRIGGWINHQKDAFKAFQMISSPNSTEEEKSKDQKMRIGILSPERQTQLNGLFTWRQWMNEDPWETTFQLCQQWESLNPNQSIPQRTSQIGRWINTQKASWKKTQILEHPDSTLEEKSKAQKIKGTLLSPERQTRLNELFTWRQWMKGEDPWNTTFQLCQQWELLNPNQSIPSKTSKIGTWIDNQKTSWKKTQILEHPDSTLEEKSKAQKVSNALLSPKRQTRLNDLFTWRQWMTQKSVENTSTAVKRSGDDSTNKSPKRIKLDE